MPNENDHSNSPAKINKPRIPYEKPSISRVDLSLEETLATGCKETAEACLVPPNQRFAELGS